MAETTLQRPWDELEQLVEAGDAAALGEFLAQLPSGETARALSRLVLEDQIQVLETLEPADAAQLVDELPDAQAADLIHALSPTTSAAILRELDSDDQADLLGNLDDDDAEAILAEFTEAEAGALRALADYDPDVAGGLMQTELLAYPVDATIGEVVADLQSHGETYADYAIQYVYVVGRRRRLTGVLRLRDLILRHADTPLGEVMIPKPIAVEAHTSLDDLEELFDRQEFLGVPVVSERGRLLGLVRRSALHEALADRADSDYRKSLGIVGGEELRSMPLLRRSGRRLSWLAVNIVLNVVAASVIALNQETLAAVIALAAVLPIISDMSGCSGNQAVAVSMRELALGLVQPGDLMRVAAKELALGLVNGAALGLLLGILTALWQGNPWFGAVVGGALALNTVVAVLIGGTVPLLLRRLGFDPALASGPILTTITDLCGFLLTLTLAGALLARLVG